MVTFLSAAVVSTEFLMVSFWLLWVSSAGLRQPWRAARLASAMITDLDPNPSSDPRQEGTWLSEVPAW